MPPRTAPEAGLDTEDDDNLLAGWGLDDDDQDEDGPESPEPGDPEGPTAEAVQADEDAALPGEAVEEPAAPAQPEAPAAPAAPPEAQPQATATAEADPAPAEVTPWSFTADGKSVTIPRSQVFEAVTDPATGKKERFILLPEAEAQRTLQPHLADRGTWRQKERTYLEQIAQLAPEHNEDVVKARELTAFVFSLLELPEDQLLAAVHEFRSQRPVWDAKQEAAAARAQLEAKTSVKQEADTALQQLDERELEEQLQTGLRHHLTAALQRPEFAGIPFDRAYKLLWRQAPSLFFEADADLPEAGLKKGERGILLNVLTEILQEEVEYAKELRGRAGAVSKIEKDNAAALGKPAAAPKPKPATRPQPKADEEPEDPWADVFNTDDD